MVLCLTHSNDFYTIDIVQRHLEQLGVPSFRFNTDEFATGYRLNYRTEADTGGAACCLSTLRQKICASEISAVWYRKMWDLQVPEELDPAYRPVFVKEYQTYLKLFFRALGHVPWMNSLEADRRAGGDKLQQLLAARSAGLETPATIFTNDPAVVRDFFKKHCTKGVIMKLHGALSKSMQGNAPFFPTTRLYEDGLKHLDTLAYCPMIFQEYIPKAYELRIVYADGAFFTGKIPHEEGKTDWRVAAGRPFSWQPYDLPGTLQEKIGRLMHELDLTFGAIDMIRHTGGSYVFLEVNPQGEWGMLQKHLGYPIGETIAEKLKGKSLSAGRQA